MAPKFGVFTPRKLLSWACDHIWIFHCVKVSGKYPLNLVFLPQGNCYHEHVTIYEYSHCVKVSGKYRLNLVFLPQGNCDHEHVTTYEYSHCVKVSVHLRQNSLEQYRGSTHKWVWSWKPSRSKVQTCVSKHNDKKWYQVDIPTSAFMTQSQIFHHCWKTFLTLRSFCVYLICQTLWV